MTRLSFACVLTESCNLRCDLFNSCSIYCCMTFNNKDYKISYCPHKRMLEYIKNNMNSICGEKNE